MRRYPNCSYAMARLDIMIKFTTAGWKDDGRMILYTKIVEIKDKIKIVFISLKWMLNFTSN